jgi:hypothetical protein
MGLLRAPWVLAALLLASNAWAEKRDVIIQCAQSCDPVVASVRSLGGDVNIRYDNVAAIAASVPKEKLPDLAAMAGIKAVRKDVMIQVPRPVGSGQGKKGMGTVSLEQAAGVKALTAAQLSSLASSQPGDYAFNNAMIGASALHAGGNFGAGVIVAVIDTGTTNAPVVPSLSGTVIGGENFVAADPVQSATSRNNGAHGTWVGTVIASHVAFEFSNGSRLVRSLKANGAGTFVGDCPNPPASAMCLVPMIGVAPSASIYALKVFDSRGGGAPESRVIAAMDRAITLKRNYSRGMSTAPVAGNGSEDNPYRYNALNIGVVNMSLGGPTLYAGRDLEDELTLQMVQAGITLAASAGNDGFAAMTGGGPGTGFGSLTVGAASTSTHERILRDVQFGVGFGPLFRPTTHVQTADFSSRGPTADGRFDPDVTANGVASFAQGSCQGVPECIAGTAYAPINLVSGTSFSSPTAAGAAALLRKAYPAASAIQVRNALAASAIPNVLGDGSGKIDQGAGFLNLGAAASALAGGRVSGAIDRGQDPDEGNGAVLQNIGRIGFGAVNFSNNRFTTRVSNLRPGQVAQFFVRSRLDTTRLVVRLRNITPEKPAAQQNQLFGDDIFLEVVDAPTSYAEFRVVEFVNSNASFTVDNPQTGLVRVAIQGDWTNAGRISADLEIEQQLDALPKQTAKGQVAQGSLTAVGIDIAAGTQQAVFELFWDMDWAAYPTNDVDLILMAPDGTLYFEGATLASPERVALDKPAAGRWTAYVSGFTVREDNDNFTLRVTADGKALKAAK